MKTHDSSPHPPLLRLAALVSSLALGLTASAAENAVLLEGFETNIDSAVSVNARTTLAPYTSVPDATFVTQGSKSLEITVSETEFWGHDFDITFSEEASQLLRNAVSSNQVARYVLRFDFIFPTADYTAWMSAQVGSWGLGDQLDSNNGTNTMSLPLDLIGAMQTPEEGPVKLEINLNFDAVEDPFSSLKAYLDNIRLVDTYAPGAQPVVYVLQSFESSTDPTGGASDIGARTTYSQYTAVDTNDIRVSEGTRSLKVDYAGAGGWGQDFTVPLAGTKLAEVLKLDLPAEQRPTRDELARYTLRFETIYPSQEEGLTVGSWINTSYNGRAAGFPWSQGGDFGDTGSGGFRRTYSVTLDQLSWSDTADPMPAMGFIANGDWGDPGIPIYYDNFRLIDTAPTGTANQPQIQSINLDAQKKVVITWTGGGTLQWSPSLAAPQWNPVTGATSGSPIDPPAGGVAFYRVQGQ
jgi:hypothetical protein